MGKRKLIHSGNDSFDKYFGILSGTTTIMYVQNQTFRDPMAILMNWFTRDVESTETILLVTTYHDPVTIARWCERNLAETFKVFVDASQDDRFWWIDLFTYRGFAEHERASIHIGYNEHFRGWGADPKLLISLRKPEDLQSVDGLPAAISNLSSSIHGKGTIRMVFAYVDDFVDGVGAQPALNYLRRLINIMRKFGHTLIFIMGWRSTTQEFHTACERMVDQVLRWGYGDVPGIRHPSKFLQILKSTAPDELVSYQKVPYTMRTGIPTVGLATPLEQSAKPGKPKVKK